MRTWRPTNIDTIRKKRGMSFLGFVTECTKRGDAYGLKPSTNYVRDIINNISKPQPAYVALFADVLECPTDAFFVVKKSERRKR